MRIYECADYSAMSRQAANIISAQVILEPQCVLGLATGSTPIGTYEQLVEWYKKGDLSFAGVRSVNLDEYRGLSAEHDQSYRYFMQTHLFDHVDIRRENTNVPNGMAEDPAAECARYDQIIRDLGGIDLQLLGMGHNGHIGFNEPTDYFPLGTHLVDLTQSTIEANTRFFHSVDEVPRQAVSLGIGAIMRARQVVLIATGPDKAQAIHDSVLENVIPQVPCSILRYHPNAIFLLDREAASLL